MEKVKTFFTARNIATMGILLALVVVLQVFAGAIPIGTASLNLSLIPIVLGALVLGPIAGAILGFASGIVVLIQVIEGLSAFYVLIWTYSPFITTLICLLKTTIAGCVAGFVFRLISKKNTYVATFVAAALVPVINTTLFILGCLCMPDTVNMMNSGGENIFVYICVSLVTFNFFIELAVNLIVAPALHVVYRTVEKQFARHRKGKAAAKVSPKSKAKTAEDNKL